MAEVPPFLLWLGTLADTSTAALAGLGLVIQAALVWNLARRLKMHSAPVLGAAALIPGVNAGVIVLLTLRVSRVRKSFGATRRRVGELAPEEEREVDLSLSRPEIAILCALFLFFCANYALSAAQQMRREGLRAFERGDYQTARTKLKWLFFCDDPAVRARRAFCAFNNASNPAEATRAVERLRSLADNDPVAAWGLGLACLTGRGAPLDKAQARRCFEQAAEQDFAPAATHLGLMLLDIPGREAEGVAWLKKAAGQKYPAAWNYLGLCYENGTGAARDVREAVHCYGTAIFLGDQNAVFNMAGLLDSRLSGNEPNVAAFFRRAAKAGNPAAMTVFSAICWNGRGMAKDPDLALQWARKAADAGHPGGYYLLGRFYEEGGGSLKPDHAEAAKWFRKAKEAGVEDLDRKILEMDGVASVNPPESSSKAENDGNKAEK